MAYATSGVVPHHRMRTVTGQESLTYDSWFDHFWLTCPSRPDSGTFKVNQIYSLKWQTYMFDGGYLAVCTARDLGWKRVHGILHKRSRALEQFFFHTPQARGAIPPQSCPTSASRSCFSTACRLCSCTASRSCTSIACRSCLSACRSCSSR